MEKIDKIRKEITELKKMILELGDMSPGALTAQTRSWGKSYWQLSYTHRSKGCTVYVSKKNYERVRKRTENYKKFKDICLMLVDLSIELARLEDGK